MTPGLLRPGQVQAAAWVLGAAAVFCLLAPWHPLLGAGLAIGAGLLSWRARVAASEARWLALTETQAWPGLPDPAPQECTCDHDLHRIEPMWGCLHPGCPCHGWLPLLRRPGDDEA